MENYAVFELLNHCLLFVKCLTCSLYFQQKIFRDFLKNICLNDTRHVCIAAFYFSFLKKILRDFLKIICLNDMRRVCIAEIYLPVLNANVIEWASFFFQTFWKNKQTNKTKQKLTFALAIMQQVGFVKGRIFCLFILFCVGVCDTWVCGWRGVFVCAITEVCSFDLIITKF